MAEKSVTGFGPSEAKPFKVQDGLLAADGARRRYTPPRLISSEPLELAAAVCDGSAGFGKTPPIGGCGIYGT